MSDHPKPECIMDLLPLALSRLAELLASPDAVVAGKARRVCVRHRSTFGAMWAALAAP